MNLCLIPFTGVGLPGYGGDEWLAERIKIFKQFTLKSLLNQTHKDWYLWVTFRPEEKDNRQVIALSSYLDTLGVKYFFTFDGLPYWDDKFGGGLLTGIKNSLRLVRRSWRSGNWQMLKLIPSVFLNIKNKTLESRLARSLEEIRPPKVEKIYLSRIDSDDMFNKDYLHYVNSATESSALVCDVGYIYNQSTQELAYWLPKTNPPFHTIVFGWDEFFGARKHLKKYNGYRSHEDVTKVFKYKELPDGLYCVLTHSPKLHISTTWNHPFRGAIIEGEVRGKLLANFGIK